MSSFVEGKSAHGPPRSRAGCGDRCKVREGGQRLVIRGMADRRRGLTPPSRAHASVRARYSSIASRSPACVVGQCPVEVPRRKQALRHRPGRNGRDAGRRAGGEPGHADRAGSRSVGRRGPGTRTVSSTLWAIRRRRSTGRPSWLKLYRGSRCGPTVAHRARTTAPTWRPCRTRKSEPFWPSDPARTASSA